MADERFLDVIEERVEEASIHKLFGGEGEGVRAGSRRRGRDPEYQRSLDEALKFAAEVFDGARPASHLREAMTTSDFPLLFGDVIDRMILTNYLAAPSVWENFMSRNTVGDFRAIKRYALSGAETALEQVGEQAEYPEAALSEAVFTYAVHKYGRRVPFSWEAFINADLGQFRDILDRLGKAAKRTESKFATGLYVDANGPHASLYTTGLKNKILIANGALVDNPVLGIAGLQDAFNVLARIRDDEGEPMVVDAVHLVVPPALEIQALTLLNATELWTTGAPGSSTQQLHVANWMRNRVKLSVDPYIPIVATGATGSTSWFVFADPNQTRPSVEMAFLRGHETPETFIKSPNAQKVGGGSDPENGDFDTDSIEYKVRHVLGGGRLDGRSSVASFGTGAP